MSDFYQTGLVATFHRLGAPQLERIEDQLASFAPQRPMALVLPALYSEVESPALPGIIDELRHVRYLNQIVVTMGGARADEFRRAKRFFADLPQRQRELLRLLLEHPHFRAHLLMFAVLRSSGDCR